MRNVINDSPENQGVITCPLCGTEDQIPGHTCRSCNRLIAGMPTWADDETSSVIHKKRHINRRRLTLFGFLILVAAFIVWLNFPFLPDPFITIFKTPTSSLTSESLPNQWSSARWDLQGTRYISDVPNQPQGRLEWTRDLGQPTRSAPVVVEGVIFVGGHFKAMALDVEAGKIIWQIDTPGQMHQSFAVAGEFVYMGLSDHRLLALDRRTGEIRWQFRANFAITSSPVVADGMVYFGSSDDFLYSLDAATGDQIWKHKLNGILRASVTISSGRLFATDSGGNLTILSARTGQAHFRFRTGIPATDAPVVTGGLAYFPTGGKLFAVDAEERSKRGEFIFNRIWTQFFIWQIPGVPAPPSQRGERWRFAPDKQASLGIVGSPAVTPETLYYGDAVGNLYARDVSSRQEIWRFQAGDGILSSPVILEDRIYFGSRDGYLYSLNRSDGTLLWRLSLDAPIEIAPVFAEGHFYVRTTDGRLHAIN